MSPISAATKHPRAKTATAFTLLELLLVVSLMVTLSAVALPRFSTTTRAHTVERGGEIVAETIRFARHEAVRRGLVVQVVFEDEGTRIRLRMQDAASLGRQEMAEATDAFLDSGIRLPHGLRIKGIIKKGETKEVRQLEFRPDGVGDPTELMLNANGSRAGKIVLGMLYDQVTFEKISEQ